jgi:mitochondrial fission protein ELM1
MNAITLISLCHAEATSFGKPVFVAVLDKKAKKAFACYMLSPAP